MTSSPPSPGRRERVVLASKFFTNLFPGDPNGGGAGRSSITAQLHETLRRMRTDYLDLYWLHNWDRNTPIEETMRALDDVVRAGKVRYIGFSNTPAWVTAQAQTMAMLRGWAPLIALQVEYSLLARTVEGEIAPLALDQQMALVPWSPLKNGFLSGKYRRGAEVTDSARAAFVGGPSDAEYAVIDVVAEVADQLGTTSSAVSLAWLRARPGTVVPILGARRLEHLENNLAALEVTLSPDHLRALDAVSAPDFELPGVVERRNACHVAVRGLHRRRRSLRRISAAAVVRCPLLTGQNRLSSRADTPASCRSRRSSMARTASSSMRPASRSPISAARCAASTSR